MQKRVIAGMQMQKEKDGFCLPLWLIWGVALLCVAGGLGSYPLLDNNEGLYAEIPREMLASGDWKSWIIPHLNGLAYMEKPPLLYWLTAISFFLFGESSWAARLVPALAALFCVGQLIWFGREIQKSQAGRLAALIFVSSLGVIVMSRTLMFDMLLTALLTAGLMRIYLFLRNERVIHLRSSLICLACAVLAKGFVAIILFAAVAVCLQIFLSQSISDLFRRMLLWLDWRAWGWFLLIVVPWHVAASAVEPVFAWFYFVNEHVLRFLGKREPHDYYAGPWWYYLPRLFVFLFPWSFVMPGLLLVRARAAADRSLHGFLLLSWLMPLLFFSLSSAKANYYLVTVMPLASLQLALVWENRRSMPGWMCALPWLLLAAVMTALAYVLNSYQVGELAGLTIFSYSAQHYLAAVIWMLGLLSLLLMTVSLYRQAATAICFGGLSLALAMLLLPVVRAMAPVISTESIAADLQNKHAQAMVFLYKVFEEQSTLPFYLKKPVYILQSQSSDLYWGNRLHPNQIYWSDPQFTALLPQKKIAILVLARDVDDFLSKPYAVQFKRQEQIGNTILFVNE
jgi:4-amino-4-deoxy-L-arabinose transferase-like glycosyltransferase